jgi:hypothetical protein
MANYKDVMNDLREMAQDYTVLKQDNDYIDKMLLEVIKIERRHLYGLDTTSVAKRRKEIESFLDASFDQYREYKNETETD